MYKVVGNLWNNIEIEIISDGNRYFILDGWNGELYCNCTECVDSKGFDLLNPKKEYIFRPIYKEHEIIGKEYEIIGYEME